MGTAAQKNKDWIPKLLLALLGAMLAVLGWTCLGVARTASEQQLQPADAIIVFGAAEYSGRPSPVFRARLDHAYDLYARGLAPVVIVSGGAAEDPKYTEGGVGHDYLLHRGVPEASLIAETQSADTAQTAERVAVIMRANHMRTCIAVSDGYHLFRIRKLLEHEGIEPYLSPRPDSRPHVWWQRALAVMREAVSYLLWKLGVLS
ncbi:MAG: YdcF family protein [Acidobacteriales bacterium]|nr:YdcF family protein [Terriglobales bacterium]